MKNMPLRRALAALLLAPLFGLVLCSGAAGCEGSVATGSSCENFEIQCAALDGRAQGSAEICSLTELHAAGCSFAAWVVPRANLSPWRWMACKCEVTDGFYTSCASFDARDCEGVEGYDACEANPLCVVDDHACQVGLQIDGDTLSWIDPNRPCE